MSKIVILGGSGFIGANMIKFLKEKGHYVRAVGRSFRNERASLYKYADQIVSSDLRDFKSCCLALEDMDFAMNFSANMGGVGFFHSNDYQPFIDNMTIDMNILKAMERSTVQWMFYAASACMYPIGMQMSEGIVPALSEHMLFKSADADQMYGWEKLMITKLAERAKVKVRVGIQHTIYGPFQETHGERMKFPPSIAVKAIQAKKDGKPIEIWGNGKQTRSYLYIDDALEKIYEVLMAPEYHGAVNIGSSEPFTVTQIAEMCCDILGTAKKFKYTTDKPSGVLSRNSDNKKYNTYYKYRDQVNTREGFERMITWVQNQ
jgi:nucleoside-diphosphate-sugar epimerase